MLKITPLLISSIFFLSGCAKDIATVYGYNSYLKETSPHSLNISLGDINKKIEQRSADSNRINNYSSVFSTYIKHDENIHDLKFEYRKKYSESEYSYVLHYSFCDITEVSSKTINVTSLEVNECDQYNGRKSYQIFKGYIPADGELDLELRGPYYQGNLKLLFK